MPKRTCLVYSTSCAEHGFFHGAEATELREGIEHILTREGMTRHELRTALFYLIDKIDARDSLARLESQVPPGTRTSGRTTRKAAR